ncbi:NADH dehydrogenase [ubiquinone] 1 alpha subcomplex subunit 5-like [Artibeus jamaicensis]|uniref:NADH dehydrogenase [ubiquinone] 1 alpha subcomplex subunit 5-like n=1 Tax=Artibeus jamaicensis TaxID=9417 RepID=UPI00235B2E21|nr:NADH dehydrogenase [ubiquinone] 1 alpha subcomplex subunit 5-like [Artibeus jamaicensis]
MVRALGCSGLIALLGLIDKNKRSSSDGKRTLRECRCAARPIGAARADLLKKTAGRVELAVCQSLHQRLRMLHTRILEQIPKHAAYRNSTEQVTREKLDMVKVEPDVKKTRRPTSGGLNRRGVLQAENGLSLAGKLIQREPWEPLAEEPPASQGQWPI